MKFGGFLWGTFLLTLQLITRTHGFLNITSTILRSGQTFNLTVGGGCSADYSVQFGDGVTGNINNPLRTLSHSYPTAGTYSIVVDATSSTTSDCQQAGYSVQVRDPIQDMTFAVNSSFCKIGDTVQVIVNTIPDSPFTIFWRQNKSLPWTQGPVNCTELGQFDLFVMVENGISVQTSECYAKITVVEFDFVFSPSAGAANSTVQITRTALEGVQSEDNFTFVWEFHDGTSFNCTNRTVEKYYLAVNLDPGYPVILRIIVPGGESTKLEKYLRVLEPIQPPVQVSYKSVVGTQSLVNFTVMPLTGHDITFEWDFGDNSTVQNTSAMSINHTYTTGGNFCISLTAMNPVSQAHVNFHINVIVAVEGFGFVRSIAPAETGSPTNIGIEITRGSSFNVSVNFGDDSEPVWIVGIDQVIDIFVISVWHNYSRPGQYNVNITAWNEVGSVTNSTTALVQDPVWNVTIEKKYDTDCLEVNGTLTVELGINGTEPKFLIDFGDDWNVTTSDRSVTHSYSRHNEYVVNVTAWNDVSSVIKTCNITVCKPVIPLKGLEVTSLRPVNLTDEVEFTMKFEEGSDFECFYGYGNGDTDYFGKHCYNLSYYEDGVTTDKTQFIDLNFPLKHNYSAVGHYVVQVNCSNRLSALNTTTTATVQIPITDLELPYIAPRILSHYATIGWDMANGTNVTFELKVEGIQVHSSVQSDSGVNVSTDLNHITLVGIYLVELFAENLVSNASLSTSVIIQDDITQLSLTTLTTTSDFGSDIPGFGSDQNTFPSEYSINYTASPDKGTNLTYWWRFGDSAEENTTEPTITHKFAEGENEYLSNVTVFNLVSSVTREIRVITEKSVMSLEIQDNSPVKVNLSTHFTLTFEKFGTLTCVTFDMGDSKGLFVFGKGHCQARFQGHTFEERADDSITSIGFSYEYDTVDAFYVNINAINTVSNLTTQIKAVTVLLTCSYPNVTMKDVGENATLAKTIVRSDPICFENVVEIECEASKTTAFKWTVYKISADPVHFQALPQKQEISVPIDDQQELCLDGTFFEFGFYELQFNVSMEGITGVSTTAVGYIQVVPTPDSLTPDIVGGLLKRIKLGNNITLDAESSVDADFTAFIQSDPKYFWLCRNSTELEFNTSGDLLAIPVVLIPEISEDLYDQSLYQNQGGCFGTGAGRLNFNGSKEEIDSRRGMIENGTYIVTLVVETETPFGKKRGAFNQIEEIVLRDPPEVLVSCEPSCPKKFNTDQKMPFKGTCIVCVGEMSFQWELYHHTIPGMDPNDLDNMEHISNQVLQEWSSTPMNSLNLALRPDKLMGDTKYTFLLRATQQNNMYGEYRYVFATNGPPENGVCDINPKEGSAMNTSFTVTCSNWVDPDLPLSYEFAYLSNNQPMVFFADETSWSDVILPMGQQDNNFILPVRVRVIDKLGAGTTMQFDITVKAPELDLAELSDIINAEDGRLKEALKRGNLQDMVEIISSVGSILNYMSGQDSENFNGDGGTGELTPAEEQRRAEEQKQAEENKQKRTELRRQIIKDLSEFEVSTAEQVKMMASSFDVTTEVYTELDTESQELALSSFSKMTSVLQKESQNNKGYQLIKETAAAILSSIGHVMLASAEQAKVDSEDSMVNLTGYTGDGRDVGLVSVKEQARNRTLELFKLIDNIASVVLENVVAGEPPTLIQTLHFNLTLQKTLLTDLGGSDITDGLTKFILPTLEDMGINFDPNGTEKYEEIKMAMTSLPENSFTWSDTSKQVKSYSVGLDLNAKEGPFNTSKFSSDAEIFIPRKTGNSTEPELFNVIPLSDNDYIQYHSVDIPSANYSIHIQVTPLNNTAQVTAFLSFKVRPKPDNFDFNWTLPDFSSCSFKNVTKVTHSSGDSGSNSSSAANITHEVVTIDVERDCERDPYTLTISNSMVGESGQYYVGIHYKEPEPGDTANKPTNSPTEIQARKRRDALRSCVPGHGRMKRSCVIIPPPPPKPTTPSKIQVGTKAPNVDFRGQTFEPNNTLHYLLRVYSSNCLFWDDENENWINKGCKVGDKTRPELVHCKCNHLTSFGSDFLVAPNPIDFDKVFSADLSKNFVVLLVVCLLFGFYVVLAVIARRYDQKDLIKLGATPVKNRAEADSPYLISIHTGWRQNAGTTSSVCIVLSGDEWESPPMPLVDFDRKVFQRGQENNFVLTLPRRLGNLTHIRIWHDNCGSNPSWYLSRVTIDDLVSEDKWYFICERWLAVEEDDGRVDRVLPVASEKELTHFQHLFVGKTVRELGDGHLWFSVISRPATSPFTRVQRLSCCLSLLCCTMVTNAMFYEVGGEKDGASSLTLQIGSFEFDLKGLIIGIQASVIMFPVNLSLVQIFRSVRPKKPKQPSGQEEPAEVTQDFSDISRCGSTNSLPKVSSQENMIKNDDDDDDEAGKKAKKKSKGLPHWCVYIAWVVCFLSSVTSALFTVFYSLAWGPEIANKWLLAFVTSFVQSILVIQPVKVVVVALMFAMIIKKPMDAGEETSDKKEIKKTGEADTEDDVILEVEDEYDRYGPPDEETLNTAREQRLKEVRMSAILKEIVTYFLFFMLLLLVAYGNRDTHAYLLQKSLHENFVDLDQLSIDLADATDVDLFWHWGRETLVPNLYPGVLYNNRSAEYKGFTSDRNNYLVGISRLRQARVEKDSCKVSELFKPVFNECLAEYSWTDEDTQDYDVGWKFLNESKTESRRRRSVEEQFAFSNGDKTMREFGDSSRVRARRGIEPVYTSTSGRQQRKRKRPGNTAKTYLVLDSAVLPDGSIISCPDRWKFHNALEVRGYPFWGRMTLYGGGGYPADLGYDYQTALTVIADLHSHNWVDKQSRAVFVEFTVYNANTNLFGIAFFFVEFLPTGGAFPYGHFVISRLYSYVGPFANFILACQIFMILFMFYFMYREGKAMYKQRKAYFHGFFNWMEVVLIVCEVAMVVLFLARLYEVDKNLMKLRYNPKDFVSFQYAGAADQSLSYVMGLLVFLVNLRFLKLLRFNKRMSLLGSTIAECAKPLGAFLISFLLVFLAYAILSFLVFGHQNEKFKNFISTIETQSGIILGDFDYEELERTNRYLGPIYFFTFMYFTVFYLLNMFMAIINDAFAEVKANNDKQINEHEMMEFILSRFKESLGLSRNRIGSKSPFANPGSGFPSSPPFQPSDYKHRLDNISECSFEMDTQSSERALSSLNQQLEVLTSFVDKSERKEGNSDDMLFELISIAKKEDCEEASETSSRTASSRSSRSTHL